MSTVNSVRSEGLVKDWFSTTEFSSTIGTLCRTHDDKVLVFGESGAEAADFTLGRYQLDGALDTTFGADGLGYRNDKFPHFESAEFFVLSAFQQPDKNIFMTGVILDYNESNFLPTAARFLESGLPDTSFGIDGKVVYKFSKNKNSASGKKPGKRQLSEKFKSDRANNTGYSPSALRLKNSGYLIVSAETGYLICLKSDGSLNTEFAGNGYLRPFLSPSTEFELVGATVHNNKIFVTGHSGNNGVVACFTFYGVLDQSFGDDGSLLIKPTVGSSVVLSGVSATDSNTLNIVGFTRVTKKGNGALLTRLTADGKFDTEFNSGTPFVLHPDDRQADFRYVASAQTEKANSSIYAVGQTTTQAQGDPRFFAAAFLKDGILDTRFNADGWGFGPERSTALGMFLELPDSMFICGTTRDINFNYTGMLARYKLNTSK